MPFQPTIPATSSSGGSSTGILTKGVANPVADGIQTVFQVPHGLPSAPTTVYTTAMDMNSAGDKYTQTDNTYIYVTFLLAPNPGTLHFTWAALS